MFSLALALAAALAPSPLTSEQSQRIRCVAVLAIVAGEQQRHTAAALELPPLERRGARFAQIVGDAMMKETGRSQGQVRDLILAEVASVQKGAGSTAKLPVEEARHCVRRHEHRGAAAASAQHGAMRGPAQARRRRCEAPRGDEQGRDRPHHHRVFARQPRPGRTWRGREDGGGERQGVDAGPRSDRRKAGDRARYGSVCGACPAMRPFHLAFPVRDLAEARAFYGGLLGCPEGRSSRRVDRLRFPRPPDRRPPGAGRDRPRRRHQRGRRPRRAGPPLRRGAGSRRLGRARRRADRRRDSFVIEPHIRFKGEAGEQATMFFLDPSGNALEFKAFADDAMVFAKD